MSFPKKTVILDGKPRDVEGVGLCVWGHDFHAKHGIFFDAIQVPLDKSGGRELWALTERSTHFVVSGAMPTIDEARDEFKKIVTRSCKRHSATIEAVLLLMKEKLVAKLRTVEVGV